MTPGALGPEEAMSPEAFAARMASLHKAGPLALAVSGGGDSMALMALAADWAEVRNIPLLVLTVDHGLRAGSADDAAFVAEQAQALGLNCALLNWTGDKPASGVQAAAREARYRLMANTCRAQGVRTLALAHTREDQAETVLMRLARGSGVDGLSGMATATELFGLRLVRPLLDVPRAALRAVLAMHGQAWRDDPTNEDATYERVRARKTLQELAPLGVDTAALALTAARMGEARVALDAAAADLGRRAATFDAMGYARFDPASLSKAPRELALRLLSAAIRWVSGAPYAPGREECGRALDWMLSAPVAGGRTLHGCQFDARQGGVTLARETAAATAKIGAAEGGIWDGRFHCDPMVVEQASGLTIAALGADGARRVKAWGRAPVKWSRAPRAAKLASPALWSGKTLLNAPSADYVAGADAPRLHALTTPAPFSLKGPGESLC